MLISTVFNDESAADTLLVKAGQMITYKNANAL